jgi:predicted nucleotidyltransferase
MHRKSREEIINILKYFFKEKNENYGIEMVFLYGSWAVGFPKEDSDVDIAIVFKKESASEEDLFDSLNDLSLTLTKEIGLEVNAIPILPDFPRPMLYYNAIVSGILIFIENVARYAEIRNEAVHQMEDFNLFGTGWQIRIARKNLEELKHG